VTIVTAEDIERFGYRTLDEVLETVRGFYISSDHNYSYIGIRGFGRPTDYNNRLLILLNGQALNETYYSAISSGYDLGIAMQAVDRIELVRGPASALYGSSAMFAVINIVTKKGQSLAGVLGEATAGSYGQRRASAAYGGTVGGVDLMLAGSIGRHDGTDLYFPEYDAPETNNGLAADIDWERYENVVASASLGRFSLQARSSWRRKGVPTASWGSNFNDNRQHTTDDYSGFALTYESGDGGSVHWSARAQGSRYYYYGLYPSDYEYQDENIGYWGGFEGQLIWDLAPNHRLTAGGDLVRTFRAKYRYYTPEFEIFEDDFTFNTWSTYLMDELQLTSALTLMGGLRHDAHSAARDALSPRLGIIVNPGRTTTVKLLWGEAFRSPSVYEREFFNLSDFKRNPDLNRERITTTELVWEQRLGSAFRLTSSLYQNQVRDLIDTTTDPEDGKALFTNVGRARARGIEAEFSARHANGATAYVNYVYQDAVDRSNDARLTNSPRHLFKAGGAMPMPLGTVAVEGRYEDDRITVQGGATDEAVVVNAHFVSQPLFGGLRLTARVRDLFDSGFRVPGGFEHLQASIPQEPRSLSIGLAYGVK
jgi:iron complex outermembrane receptor protein